MTTQPPIAHKFTPQALMDTKLILDPPSKIASECAEKLGLDTIAYDIDVAINKATAELRVKYENVMDRLQQVTDENNDLRAALIRAEQQRVAGEKMRKVLFRMNIEGGHGYDNHRFIQEAITEWEGACTCQQ